MRICTFGLLERRPELPQVSGSSTVLRFDLREERRCTRDTRTNVATIARSDRGGSFGSGVWRSLVHDRSGLNSWGVLTQSIFFASRTSSRKSPGSHCWGKACKSKNKEVVLDNFSSPDLVEVCHRLLILAYPTFEVACIDTGLLGHWYATNTATSSDIKHK